MSTSFLTSASGNILAFDNEEEDDEEEEELDDPSLLPWLDVPDVDGPPEKKMLKALFNNVFTLKKIWAACPYILSVSLIRRTNEALKKIAPQKHH